MFVAKNFSDSLIKNMKNILSTLSVLLDIHNLELLYPKHRMHSPLEDPYRMSKQYFK
jgi:hypothetical protein